MLCTVKVAGMKANQLECLSLYLLEYKVGADAVTESYTRSGIAVCYEMNMTQVASSRLRAIRCRFSVLREADVFDRRRIAASGNIFLAKTQFE